MDFMQKMLATLIRSQIGAITAELKQQVDSLVPHFLRAAADRIEGKNTPLFQATAETAVLESKTDEELWALANKEPQMVDGLMVSQSFGVFVMPILSILFERFLRDRIQRVNFTI